MATTDFTNIGNVGFNNSASAPPPPPMAAPPPYEAHNFGVVSAAPYSGGGGQVPPPFNTQESREAKFREIVNKHEINLFFSSKLQKLSQFKVVFIFDDSGSMNTTLDDSPLNTGLLKVKRWDELKYFSSIGIEIVNLFNPNGYTDVYFLNRPKAHHVQAPTDLEGHFRQAPNGYTPLARVFNSVLMDNSISVTGDERKLLVVIVTDGEPTDDSGRGDIRSFRRALEAKPSHVYTTIVSCTDEEDTMAYLNNWDKCIPRLDIVDDYRSEKTEIKQAQGKNFSFTFGDYVVKCLIGSFDSDTDKLDERRQANNGCCLII